MPVAIKPDDFRMFRVLTQRPNKRLSVLQRLTLQRSHAQKSAAWLLSKDAKALLNKAQKLDQYKTDPVFKNKIDNLSNLRRTALRNLWYNRTVMALVIVAVLLDIGLFAGALSLGTTIGTAVSYLFAATGLSTAALTTLSALAVGLIVMVTPGIIRSAFNTIAGFFRSKMKSSQHTVTGSIRSIILSQDDRISHDQVQRANELSDKFKSGWFGFGKDEILGRIVIEACGQIHAVIDPKTYGDVAKMPVKGPGAGEQSILFTPSAANTLHQHAKTKIPHSKTPARTATAATPIVKNPTVIPAKVPNTKGDQNRALTGAQTKQTIQKQDAATGFVKAMQEKINARTAAQLAAAAEKKMPGKPGTSSSNGKKP